MLELAELVKSVAGSNSQIEFSPLPMDDPMQRRPNIDKAREILDWRPSVELEQGLVKTIEYFSDIVKR